MTAMLKTVVYPDEDVRAAQTAVIWPDGELPPILMDYLRERRRAIITELRKIEEMLELEPSIPQRQRPH